jgi:hypothetical protein
MQAFANTATAPVQKTTKGGKAYWEFRAAESAKNEDKDAATWYTVRVFQQEDPGFTKGDFIRIVGKLKLDVFMSRDGKPMGVLVIMAYETKKYDKTKPGQPSLAVPQANVRQDILFKAAEPDTSLMPKPLDVEVPFAGQDIDESWLALVE